MLNDLRYKIPTTKKDILNYMIIIVVVFSSVTITMIVDNISVHILAMWIISIVAIIVCKYDIMHPYFWFSIFFTLYSTANAILLNAGVREGSYSREQILYPIIALSIVLVITGPKRIDINPDNNNSLIFHENNIVLSRLIFAFSIIIMVASIILHLRGYSSKVVMRRSGDVIFKYSVHIARYMTIFVILYLGKTLNKENRIPLKLVLFSGASALMFSLFTSERDVVFRFGYTVLLLLFAYKVIKHKHLPIIVVVSVAAVVVSVFVKHYFLRGIIHSGSGNIFYDFLSSDFNSSGRNLQYLLDNTWTKGELGIKTYFTELLNPFLIGIRTEDPDYWFNYVVHTGGYKGYAFSLVGTGYAISGLFGVVIVFITVGCFIRYFYIRVNTNSYWLASYIYLSSTIIFSFRQSLQTITGSLVKHIGLAILLCVVLDKYFSKKEMKQSIYAEKKVKE